MTFIEGSVDERWLKFGASQVATYWDMKDDKMINVVVTMRVSLLENEDLIAYAGNNYFAVLL